MQLSRSSRQPTRDKDWPFYKRTYFLNPSECTISARSVLSHHSLATLSACSTISKVDGTDWGAFTTPFQETQASMQFAAHINTNIPPTSARESERPLQRGINRPFVSPASFSCFLNTCNPLQELLQMMPNLQQVLWGLETRNMGQTSVEEFLQRIAEFGRPLQKGQTKRLQKPVLWCNSRHKLAEISRFRAHLDASEDRHRQLHS